MQRLVDVADELSRAGDEAGMIRILDDIRRMIQNATAAREAVEVPRADRMTVDEVAAATVQPGASNAESSRMPESARVRAGEGVRI